MDAGIAYACGGWYVCMTREAMFCSNLHICLMLRTGGCGGGAWWWWGRCGGIDAKVT